VSFKFWIVLSLPGITEEEKTITCGKLESGKIEYGLLEETGLPEEKCNCNKECGSNYCPNCGCKLTN